MIKIINNIYVGDSFDYHKIEYETDWFFINAAKEPYHRNALGYKTRGCPKTRKLEYYFCYRSNHLILNLIDADTIDYIPKQIIDESIAYLDKHKNDNVLINCNKGESRSATIGMLFMKHLGEFKGMSFEEAVEEFKKIYPPYKPGIGMYEFAKLHWNEY